MQPDYRRLSENTADAVFRWLFESGLTYFNPGFEQLTGVAATEAADPGLFRSLIDPQAWAELDGVVERLRRGAAKETMVAQLVRRRRRPGVGRIPAGPGGGRSGRSYRIDGVGRDLQHLAVADQLSAADAGTGDVARKWRELLASWTSSRLEQDRRAGPTPVACHDLHGLPVGVDGLMLRPLASAGEFAQELMAQRPRLGEGLTGWVVEHGLPQKVDRTDLDPRPAQVSETPEEDESLLCAPLEIRGQVAGALLLSGEPDQYTENDLDFLVALAQVASLAIANSQTFDLVRSIRRRSTSSPRPSTTLPDPEPAGGAGLGGLASAIRSGC
jgi:PAS domain S-box-containing protein